MQHFDRNENDDHPFEPGAVPVLKDVFEEFEVFFYNAEAFLDVPEAFLEVEGFL